MAEEIKSQFNITQITATITVVVAILGGIFTIFNWMIMSELKPITLKVDAIETRTLELGTRQRVIFENLREKIEWLDTTVLNKTKQDLVQLYEANKFAIIQLGEIKKQTTEIPRIERNIRDLKYKIELLNKKIEK